MYANEQNKTYNYNSKSDLGVGHTQFISSRQTYSYPLIQYLLVYYFPTNKPVTETGKLFVLPILFLKYLVVLDNIKVAIWSECNVQIEMYIHRY